MVTYSRIESTGMEQCITTKHCHASSVRPDSSGVIFTLYAMVSFSFSPSVLVSPLPVTLSRLRGADDHAALVVGIVVVITAVAIHIVEIVTVIGRPQPPPRGAGRAQKLTCALDVDHCKFL